MTWSSNTVLSRRSRIASGSLPRSSPRTRLLWRRSGHLTSAGRLRKNSHRSMSANGRRTAAPARGEQQAPERLPVSVHQEVGHEVARAATGELRELPGEDVVVAEATRQGVIVGQLWHGHDGHGAAEAATPFLHIVERASLRAVRVELHPEALGDECDIAKLVDGGQLREDGRKGRHGPAGAAVGRRGGGRPGGGGGPPPPPPTDNPARRRGRDGP